MTNNKDYRKPGLARAIKAPSNLQYLEHLEKRLIKRERGVTDHAIGLDSVEKTVVRS